MALLHTLVRCSKAFLVAMVLLREQMHQTTRGRVPFSTLRFTASVRITNNGVSSVSIVSIKNEKIESVTVCEYLLDR